MTRIDWRQVGRDLVPLAPIVAVCVVLALNITLHHKAYAPPAAPVYIAPLIIAPPVTQASTTTSTTAPRAVVIWDSLADCESGQWDRYGVPIPGSRNWASTSGGYEGGPHFTPGTWTSNKPTGYPAHAYQATRAQQIVVGERVLEVQGVRAWPVCGPNVGLR